MRRPAQPSGEALSATQIIHRAVTHPTQVVELLRPRRGSEAVRLSEAASRRLLGVGATGVLFGALVALLGLASRNVPGLVGGFTLLAGGFALVSLEGLLSPERPAPDERVWDTVKKWSRR